MLTLIIIGITFCVLAAVLIRPKWGSSLIWLVLFTYPHNWWFQHSYLPLNIGADDLLCILLFAVVVLRRNLLGSAAVRFGYAFWIITAFLVVNIIAIISGSMDAPAFERVYYIKDILKMFVYWGLFYAILHCIDDIHDLRQQFTMFAIAAVSGALIVILHGLMPARMQYWSNPLLIDIESITHRATGAFLNANSAACVLNCSLAMVITAIRFQRSVWSKLIIYLFCALLMIGVLVTRSRSGLMTLAGVLLLMGCFGSNKKVAWMIILAGLVLGTLMVGMRQAVGQRVAQVYNTRSGTWGKNVTGRLDTWIEYFETATPRIYILGQGYRAGIARNGSESHSAYVAVITVYGLGGIVWALAMLAGFIRKLFSHNDKDDPLIGISKSGCMWAMIAWCVYALSADALSSQYTRYLLFYLIVLLDRTWAIARDESGRYNQNQDNDSSDLEADLFLEDL